MSVSYWTIAWGIVLGFLILSLIGFVLALLGMWIFGPQINSVGASINNIVGNVGLGANRVY